MGKGGGGRGKLEWTFDIYIYLLSIVTVHTYIPTVPTISISTQYKNSPSLLTRWWCMSTPCSHVYQDDSR